MSVFKIAIITSHPIQYNAPFFKKLAESERWDVMVFYTWNKEAGDNHDPGFGRAVKWDIPLLQGYKYTFVKNTSKEPGSHHYYGIVCPTLNREVQEFAPDAVLIYGWNFKAHLSAMRYFKGKIPVWFRGDSTLLAYSYKTVKDIVKIDSGQTNTLYKLHSYVRYHLRLLYLTFVFKNVDIAFYAGENNKDYFIANGLKLSQLVYMPHAVDGNFFSEKKEDRENQAKEWRKSLGIDEKDFVLLYAGKFELIKNLESLIYTVININESIEFRNQDIKIKLILAGNGILEEQFRKIAEGKDYIIFLPFQNQSVMPVLYRLGDAFCLPSKSETWGLSVNEAMACGRPVIVSDKVGCAQDLVKNEINGYIYPAGDLNALAAKIKDLYLYPGKRKDFSLASLKIIEQYSFDAMIKALESISDGKI